MIILESKMPNISIKIFTPWNIRGVSKTFGEWSDISTATWARCTRMHMSIQRYVEKRHLA
jgi:hypothetical protein